MTCSDVEKLLPEILDGAPSSASQAAFDIHVKSCRDCSDLISDLKSITNEAQFLAATDEPAPRVWVNVAAQLKAEGLIRDPAPNPVPGRPRLVPALPRRRWSAWLIAPVAAALVAAGSYVINHKPAPQIAQQSVSPSPAIAPVAGSETPVGTTSAKAPESTPASRAAPTGQPSQKSDVSRAQIASAPSPEDQQFLQVVSTRAPSMRASYENHLQAVNADIRETQAYVDRNPGDAEARQHLMDAYQQKSLLYQIALDRIQ